MRIYSVEVTEEISGIFECKMDALERCVILSGENGSGKTRLLKLIEKVAKSGCDCPESQSIHISYADDSGRVIEAPALEQIFISNYSYSELPLQSAKDFPPYVIGKAQNNLRNKRVDFGQTASDALLYLVWLTKYAEKSDLDNFNNDYCAPLMGGTLTSDANKMPLLFGQPVWDLTKAPISPGQKYLLRLCVALNCNIIPPGSILFLDEPESHLHPKVLLELFDKLQNKFQLGQVWIATHSVELISNFWYQSVWYMHQGRSKQMGSRSEEVLKKLIGENDKRFLLRQFISSPDTFACNVFAVECLCNPKVIQEVTNDDPSTGLVHEALQNGDVLLDFGAGKGRFLESYFLQLGRPEIQYIAYDKYGYCVDKETNECSANICKAKMEEHGIPTENYFGSEDGFNELLLKKGCCADKVLLINVLHEIAPKDWKDVFNKINSLLKDDGQLVIVEREELTIGEKPFESDFFVLQQRSLAKLFMCSTKEFITHRHNINSQVVAHFIPKSLICNVSEDAVRDAILETEVLSEENIREIKSNSYSQPISWKAGIKLAFWTHQYANARLFGYGSIDTS